MAHPDLVNPHPPGGSGSSGPAQATAEQINAAMEAARSSYREILRRWGIPVTKNMLNFIEKAIVGNGVTPSGLPMSWNTTMFVDHLRHTVDYHEKFPGILFNQGMTESTYNAQYISYRGLAKSIGEDFSRAQFARALKHGVTPDEFKARITAVDSMEKWGPMLEGFKGTLEANGLVDKADNVTRADLMKMVMGLGPMKWNDLWEETVVGVNLERVAGVTVGDAPKGWGVNDPNLKGGGSPASSVDSDWMHTTRESMLRIIHAVDALNPGHSLADMTSQQWRDIGARMRQFKGSYLAKYDITEDDLLEMELGGPRAAAIADKSQRILAEQDAAAQARAVPQEAQQVGQPQAGYRDLPQQA